MCQEKKKRPLCYIYGGSLMLKIQVWLKQTDLQTKVKYINLFKNIYYQPQKSTPRIQKIKEL